MSHNTRRRHRTQRRQRRHKMRGGGEGDGDVPVQVQGASNGEMVPDSSVSGAMSGGRKRGKRSRGAGSSRSRNGGFFENLGMAIKDAIVPFALLYTVTRKNRGKKGGRDDVA